MRPLPYTLRRPWAITDDYLRTILAIQQRGEVFGLELSRAREAWEKRKASDLADDMAGAASVLSVVDGVAVIAINGPLMRHASMFSDISGATSYDAIWQALEVAKADATVKAVLLRVNSPGGEADGCSELARYVAQFPKPVEAYVESLGASAAYWIASAADKITAHDTAFVGSIGVRITLVDKSGADEMDGVKRIEIVASQSPAKRATPVDDDVQARAQTEADDLAAIFIADVAGWRGVDARTVAEAFGAGDVLIASKALAAGSIDAIGDFNSTLGAMRASATNNISGARLRAAAKGISHMATKADEDQGEQMDAKKCAACSQPIHPEAPHYGACCFKASHDEPDGDEDEDEDDEQEAAFGRRVLALCGADRASIDAALGTVARWKSDAEAHRARLEADARAEADRASAAVAASIESAIKGKRLTLGRVADLAAMVDDDARAEALRTAITGAAGNLAQTLAAVRAEKWTAREATRIGVFLGSAPLALPRASAEPAGTEQNLDIVHEASTKAAREGGLVDEAGAVKSKVMSIAAMRAANKEK